MLEYLTESLYSRMFWISFVNLKKNGKVLRHKDHKVRLRGGGEGGGGDDHGFISP